MRYFRIFYAHFLHIFCIYSNLKYDLRILLISNRLSGGGYAVNNKCEKRLKILNKIKIFFLSLQREARIVYGSVERDAWIFCVKG